jgi:hypothetical protein
MFRRSKTVLLRRKQTRDGELAITLDWARSDLTT